MTFRTLTAACLLLLGSTQVEAAEVTVKLYREVMASKNESAINQMRAHLAGMGSAIEWTTAYYQTIKKIPPFFCAPSIGLDVNNYMEILEAGIKANQNTMTPAQLDESFIGQMLLQGLIETFPCK
jgi:hypothetical protein